MLKEKSKKIKTTFFKKTALFGLFFLAFFFFSLFSGAKEASAQAAQNYVCQKETRITGGYISYNQVPYTEAACRQAQSTAPSGVTYTWIDQSQFQNNATTKTTSKVLQAGLDPDTGGCSIFHLDICLLKPVMWLVKLLFITAASLFAWINDVNNIHFIINNNSALYEAWTTVRDILNIVFILILLFSAFCTIFQISKYNYKKILLTLVIMALLVNFSFPIARVIIDASNVMMYDIIKNKIVTGNFSVFIGEKTGIGEIVNAKYTSAGMMLTAIVFVFILSITLLAVGILLVIRMVALAILIIFSPLGFVGNIMPGFEKYASQWWDNLFRYAFFGPIMMLGLYIAISVMEAMVNLQTQTSMTTIVQAGMTKVDPNIVGKLGLFSIPIVILWMTMGLANSMSIAGASTVMGAAQKALKWSGKTLSGYRLGKALTKAGVHRVERSLAKGKYTKFLVPRVYKEAYKQRTAMKDREAFEGSTGEMHDLFNKVLSLGKEKTDYAHAAHEGKVGKYAKEISDVDTNAEYVIKELEAAVKNKNVAKAEAALKVLGKENNWNDMMHAIGDKYGDKVKIASPIHFKNAMRDMLAQASGKNDQAWKDGMDEFLAKEMMGLSGIGINAGNIGSAGMSKFDKTTGRFRDATIQEQVDVASAKFQNLEPQQRQRTTHHNSILGEDENGNIAEIDPVQAAILSRYDEGDIDQMNRNRADMRRQVKKAETGIDSKGRVAISAQAQKVFKDIEATNSYLKTYAEAIGQGRVKA